MTEVNIKRWPVMNGWHLLKTSGSHCFDLSYICLFKSDQILFIQTCICPSDDDLCDKCPSRIVFLKENTDRFHQERKDHCNMKLRLLSDCLGDCSSIGNLIKAA